MTVYELDRNEVDVCHKDKDKKIEQLEARLEAYQNSNSDFKVLSTTAQRAAASPLNDDFRFGYNSSQTSSFNRFSAMAPELNSGDQDSLGSGRGGNHFQQMCLESTEIDYLRQIVYSYMMGTDPVVSCSRRLGFVLRILALRP